MATRVPTSRKQEMGRRQRNVRPQVTDSPERRIADNLFPTSITSKNIAGPLAWVCFLIFLAIYFQNKYDTLTYQTAEAKRVMNEKRAIYISEKKSYSLESKQSELIKRLADRGLDKSVTPPIKVMVVE